jgi:16S rRNA (guanine966-N2)-methyltransferase
MRIIAGIHRGRRLLSPQNDATRPITDRVKQSLFDVLSPRIEGARVLDLFAGTGSMGLESLSRGANSATFFESDRSAVRLLRQNVESLNLADRSTIISLDLFKWFNGRQNEQPSRADLVFLDPPYRFLTERAADLLALAGRLTKDHLAPDGVVLFRHDAANELDLTPLQRSDLRTYGSMTIEFLTCPHDQC